LINGASGNIGKPVTQALAKKGADITAVCSAAKADEVMELGASRVIDYRKGSPLEQLPDEKFDMIYDFSGGEQIAEESKTLKSENGQFISTVGPVPKNGETRLGPLEFGSMILKIGPSYFKGEFIAPMNPNRPLIVKEIVEPDIRSTYQNEISMDDIDEIKNAIINIKSGKTIIVNNEAIAALGEKNPVADNPEESNEMNQAIKNALGAIGFRIVGPALIAGSGAAVLSGAVSGPEGAALLAAGHTAGAAIMVQSANMVDNSTALVV